MNETLVEHAQHMQLSIDLSEQFWAEAVNNACYLVNRSPPTAMDCKTPQWMWFRNPTNILVYECLDSLLTLV